MTFAVPTAPLPLVEGELVDDRALEALDRDFFGHKDFVRELAGLVCATKTPASIALFGPWGSGKSGIANLLKAELPKDKKKLRFVVFDASKYAETPLRRHFISQVAHELGIKCSKYHEGLYTGTEGRDVTFRRGDWGKLALAFLAAIGLTLAVLLAIATGVAGLSRGPFEDNWTGIVKDYLLATIPVAAVITTFVKLAADGLHFKTTRSAPAGDEEFENRFNELVDDAKTQRLVVFIDELDRCSPAQVASTLETLKTFLFVKRCVFVVAADQQVLEQALRQKVRQHTPEDVSNPYYSAGSSYLDKVFQYQLTLPPLRSPTLSRFALDALKDKPGVWTRIPALEEAISVLIPTHVTSPRRVKVLLNRFALTYRLAERRAAEGKLDADFGARAAELAKLICLQAEFPLFADDLTLDPRLPQLVLWAAEGKVMPDGVADEVVERAKAYAEGKLIVAELLAGRRKSEPPVEEGERGEDGPAATSDPSRLEEVAHQHTQQLLAYLRKTRHVPDPAPDLVYLESAGAGHGIDAVRADRLQRAAIDNDTGTVLELVAAAAVDGQGPGALLVLADVVRAEQPGIEGRNVVSALMQGIALSNVDISDCADYIADAVASHLEQATLQKEDLLGALALAEASSRAVGPKLLHAVLTHPEATTHADVAVRLLSRAGDVSASRQTELGTATVTALLDAPEQTAAVLTSLPGKVVLRTLERATDAVKSASDAHFTAKEAGTEDAEELRSQDPSTAIAKFYDAIGDEGEQDAITPRSLRVAALELALKMDRMEYRNLVRSRIAALAPITEPDLVDALLVAVARRKVGDWPGWLSAIDREAISASTALRDRAGWLVAKLWDKPDEAEPPTDAEMDAAIEALGQLVGAISTRTEIDEKVEPALDAPFALDQAVGDREKHARLAAKMVDAALIDPQTVADAHLAAAAKTLGALGAAIRPNQSQVAEAVLEHVRQSASAASEEKLREVIAAASAVTVLSDTQQRGVQLIAAAALREAGHDVDCPVDASGLTELATQATSDPLADEALALAVKYFAQTPSDTWATVEPLVAGSLPTHTHKALAERARALNSSEHMDLLDPALQRALDHPVDRTFFDAARLSEAPAARVADRLIELYEQAESPQQRRAVLGLWQQLAPSGDATRQKLMRQLYLPTVESGDEGFDLAIAFFGLVENIRGARKEVTPILERAAASDEQKKRLDDRLLQAKWRKKSLPLGRGRSVDQDEPDA